MTYYDILGINCTAGEDEIKKAYHQMLIAFHPDKYQGEKRFAARKTSEIVEAYKVLGNSAARRTYDKSLNTQAKESGYQPLKRESTHGDSFFHRLSRMWQVALIAMGILAALYTFALFVVIISKF